MLLKIRPEPLCQTHIQRAVCINAEQLSRIPSWTSLFYNLWNKDNTVVRDHMSPSGGQEVYMVATNHYPSILIPFSTNTSQRVAASKQTYSHKFNVFALFHQFYLRVKYVCYSSPETGLKKVAPPISSIVCFGYSSMYFHLWDIGAKKDDFLWLYLLQLNSTRSKINKILQKCSTCMYPPQHLNKTDSAVGFDSPLWSGWDIIALQMEYRSGS